MSTTTKLLATASILASLLCASSSFASKIDVKNETGEELTIVIEPGLGSVPDNKHAIKKVIKSGHSENVEVTKNIHFTDSFSVTGKRDHHPVKDAASVMKHTCQKLDLNQNYNVHFTKNSLGQIECTHMTAN